MANFRNPAFGTAMANAGGMMVLAAGGVGLINALGNGIAAAGEARYQARYDNALDIAINHANDMTAMARAAMEKLAELEAENIRLRAACQQRQAYIDRIKGLAWRPT